MSRVEKDGDKDPQTTRQSILDGAIRIAAAQGLAALTVQSVADVSGFTKGALFHHFSNKQVLIDAMFDELLVRFEAVLDAHIERDDLRHGCFTRAYVNAAFDPQESEPYSCSAALAYAVPADERMRAKWNRWLASQLEKHGATDQSRHLEVIRLAADGVWINHLVEDRPGEDLEELKRYLVMLTR